MQKGAEEHRRNWTRAELILAFNLYCRIPFGRIHIRNPEVIELASAIDRSPSSVSWKLANFASLDPTLAKRNIKGAAHGSKQEKLIWNEFEGNWDALAFESEMLRLQMLGQREAGLTHFGEAIEETFPEGKTRETVVRVRVNQSFFRRVVLSAYRSRCCITGIDVPELLVASHIVPWSLDVANRTNPQNGLCLNALHDRAFDFGLITFTEDLTVQMSQRLDSEASPAIQSMLKIYDGTAISVPERFVPLKSFLQYHRQHIFQT